MKISAPKLPLRRAEERMSLHWKPYPDLDPAARSLHVSEFECRAIISTRPPPLASDHSSSNHLPLRIPEDFWIFALPSGECPCCVNIDGRHGMTLSTFLAVPQRLTAYFQSFNGSQVWQA